ncbi:hypothetical protein CV014_14185 [Nostoc sp. CMAA1605]|nr:hypothetical protein [Nostoc sp. CMAA1605]
MARNWEWGIGNGVLGIGNGSLIGGIREELTSSASISLGFIFPIPHSPFPILCSFFKYKLGQ